MEYYIHTLSSLHIGSGEKYSANDYVIVHDKCYFIPKKQLFEFLTKHQLTEKYNKWLNSNTLRLEDLEEEARVRDTYKKQNAKKDYNRLLQEIKSKINFMEFCREHDCLDEFNASIKLLPHIPVHSNFKQGHDIFANVKTFNGLPYIPASSLKGAVRTALLFNWLNEFADKNSVQKLISNAINKTYDKVKKIHDEKIKNKELKKLMTDFADDLEKLAFYCPFYTNDEPDKIRYDEKFDILKFLVISDAASLNPSAEAFHIIKPQLYLNNGTIGTQAPSLEAVRPGHTFAFTASLNIQAIRNIYKNMKANSLIIKEYNKSFHYWNNLSEKCRQLFNFSPENLIDASPEIIQKTEQQALNAIFDSVRKFSVAQAEFLLKWKKNISAGRQTKSKAKTFNPENLLLPNPESELTLMNLGYASGFPGTTAFLFFLNHPEFHEVLTEYMNLFKIGQSPNGSKKNPVSIDLKKFPKSKMLNTEISSAQNAYPLGWISISTDKNAPSGNAFNSAFVKSLSVTESSKKTEIAYFTGKIKEGTELFAKFVKARPDNPKSKIFKLLVGKEGEEPLVTISYASDISPDSVYLVKVTNLSKSGIQNVQIVKKIP
jgi:CRISPR type III-A-associated RAMP protein Csm5